jgi:parvulin-like peptidyl-prolyl isomerase
MSECVVVSASRCPQRRTVCSSSPVVMLGLLGVAALALLAGGCSRGAREDVVLAKVGDRQITVGYFEDRLSKFQLNELKDKQGEVLDTDTTEGKQQFLDILINKELMALKALELGYDKQAEIGGVTSQIRDHEASSEVSKELIEAPASEVSEQEIQDYYQRMPEQRRCSYIVCNFREDAEKARAALQEGRPWKDVAEEYNDGANPTGDYQITVPYGRYDETFEKAAFSLQPGELSEPVDTAFGWWILRLDEAQTIKVPDMDEIRDRITTAIRMRKIAKAKEQFMAESRAKHGFSLDETSLWIVYQGMPEGEVLMNPETRQPTPREELKPLDVPEEDLDRVLWKMEIGGEPKQVTIGDYKVNFDKSNVFQRPKKSEMLGGLRQRIQQEVDQQLLVEEAKERGYMDRPAIKDLVGRKLEEMMVTKLHAEVVKYDQDVSDDDAAAFYQEHKAEYVVPEGRSGDIVYCEDLASAQAAANAAKSGETWDKIIDQYETDPMNRQKGGKTELFRAQTQHPIKDELFAMNAVGDISEPFQVQDKWAVVRLGTIQEPTQTPLADVKQDVMQRIRSKRQDEALEQLLKEWRQEFHVEVMDRNLAKVRSWEELTADLAAAEVNKKTS